jgi:hypothetical protein
MRILLRPRQFSWPVYACKRNRNQPVARHGTIVFDAADACDPDSSRLDQFERENPHQVKDERFLFDR